MVIRGLAQQVYLEEGVAPLEVEFNDCPHVLVCRDLFLLIIFFKIKEGGYELVK